MIEFIIYTRPKCKYCTMAKRLIEQKGDKYREKVIGVDISREELLEMFPGVKTVPQIAFQGHSNEPLEHVGGYEELVAAYENLSPISD